MRYPFWLRVGLTACLAFCTLMLASWIRGRLIPTWGITLGGLLFYLSTSGFWHLERFTLPRLGRFLNLAAALFLIGVALVLPDAQNNLPIGFFWVGACLLGFRAEWGSRLFIRGLAGAIFLGLLGDLWVHPNWKSYLSEHTQESQPSLDFVLYDAQQRPVSWEQFAGKILIIDNWSVTCRSCIAQFPDFEEFYLDFKSDTTVAIISLNLLAPFEAERGYAFEQQQEVAARYATYQFPVYFASTEAWEALDLRHVPTLQVFDTRRNLLYQGGFRYGWNIGVNHAGQLLEAAKSRISPPNPTP